MRLSRLRLRNIRRFTDPVDVAGIGPGLNILAAPNESGKSTLLDALHAVIALKHRSKSPVERALQPYQGGAPEVVLSLETDALGAVEIRKRWLSAPLAEIRGAQGLVAQGDAAEDWIAAEIGGANDMPALLWVRQGGSGLDGEFGDASLRRGLAASAAAEIEAAGGGETLEALARDLEAARAPYVTSTGRSKTGGPLKRAEDALAEAARELDRLNREAAALEADLDARARARAALAAATDRTALDPLEIARMRARSRVRLPRRSNRVLERAAEMQKAAELRWQAADTRDTRALRTAEVLHAAAADAERAAAELLAAEEKTRAADLDLADKSRAKAHAVEAAEKADRQLRRAALEDRWREVKTLTAVLTETEAALAGPDAATLDALKSAAGDLARAQAAAPTLTLFYEAGASPLSLGAAPLRDGVSVPVEGRMSLLIPGTGRLEIALPEKVQTLADAKAAFDAALGAAGQADLEAAEQAADARRAAEHQRAQAEMRLAALAPDGIAALEAERAALGTDPVEDTAAAEAALSAARTALEEADTAAALAGAAHTAARDEEAHRATANAAAQERLNAAKAAVEEAEPANPDDTAEALRNLQEAERVHRQMAKAAPDVARAAAATRDAEHALRTATKRITDLKETLAGIEGRIDALSQHAILDDRAAAEERRDAAQAALDRISFELAVLSRLEGAVAKARDTARARILTPVLGEVAALLPDILPEARLSLDPETLRAQTLVRGGVEEPVDRLSGGTAEQLAVLVRLAFARLMAREGRHAPLILDDALVYADDRRIAAMQALLLGEAERQQIIVMTCRERAFADMPATRLCLQPVDWG